MVTKKCIECKNEFKSKLSANRKFCSQRCYFKEFGNKQLGINNPNYQHGYLQAGKKNQNYKHGLHGSSFYNVWRSMLKRCNNKNHKSYKRYGGRGIKILWSSFEDFAQDMYQDYQKHCEEFGSRNTSIDRIDNNNNYYKKNCKWATWKEQAKNRDNKNTINNLGTYYVKKSITR